MKLTEPLKALSWREPYGTLMAPPVNKVETRSWPTKYRGLVLLCASQKAYPWNVVLKISGHDQFERILQLQEKNGYFENDSVNGHAFAIGKLADCKCFADWARQTSIHDIEARTFVEYHPSLYAHFYEDVRLIKPLPWKGSQGFRNVPQEFIAKIEWQ